MIKIMMTAAFALAAIGSPAIAQTSGSGTMSTGSTGSGSNSAGGMQSGKSTDGTMQSGTMSSGMMSDGSMPVALRATLESNSQMAAMKRCQASAKAMKSKSCMKMQQMHPDMMSSGAM